MPREKIAIDEYYHIYNRENRKQSLFIEERDWGRFLFLILYLQSPVSFNKIGQHISHFEKHNNTFNLPNDTTDMILSNRSAELVCFSLMPNHFHLIVHEIKEGGISKYLQRIQIAYTKYFNTKYNKSGHLFQGGFQSVHIKSNEQLLHLSAYIHRNPRELKKWKNKENKFLWSSYQDYTTNNRWGDLLKTEIISDQFSRLGEYKKFADTSGTKLSTLEEKLLL